MRISIYEDMLINIEEQAAEEVAGEEGGREGRARNETDKAVSTTV